MLYGCFRHNYRYVKRTSCIGRRFNRKFKMSSQQFQIYQQLHQINHILHNNISELKIYDEEAIFDWIYPHTYFFTSKYLRN
jgi:hypothetical protein